jgi:hypothetical protein
MSANEGYNLATEHRRSGGQIPKEYLKDEDRNNPLTWTTGVFKNVQGSWGD